MAGSRWAICHSIHHYTYYRYILYTCGIYIYINAIFFWVLPRTLALFSIFYGIFDDLTERNPQRRKWGPVWVSLGDSIAIILGKSQVYCKVFLFSPLDCVYRRNTWISREILVEDDKKWLQDFESFDTFRDLRGCCFFKIEYVNWSAWSKAGVIWHELWFWSS